MKKWYNEEYKFEISWDIYEVILPKIIAETAKNPEINTNVLTAAR